MKNTEVIKKAHALYIRVSTEAQAEEGYSISAQQERLEAYCKAMGWEDYKLYIDPGFSGSNLNRPAMQSLITHAREKKLCNVVVFKLDRLSRSQKDTLYLIEDVFLPNGVDFVSLNESIDTSTPYGRAMIGILSAFAQLERENIYLRTRMGMLERVKQGYWMGGGVVPYGYYYDRNKGILVPKQGEAENVKKVYELYIKGYSAASIANMLGLKYDRLVNQILMRKSNIGIISYKGEEYKGLHEPLISRDTFNLAMAKMKQRSRDLRADTGAYHLLTGLIYCGCGTKMRYIKWGNAGYKLRCYSQDSSKSYMNKSGEECSSPAVWADEIENIVIGDLFSVSANLEGAGAGPHEFVDPLAELEKRISLLNQKIKRLYNLYASANDDVLLDTIEENKQELCELKAEYRAEQKHHTSRKHLSGVVKTVSAVRDTWEMLSGRERQALIRDCVDKIIINNGAVEVYYKFIQKGEQSKGSA